MDTHELSFQYEDRFEVTGACPRDGSAGRRGPRSELHEIAKSEDAFWETGKCSGTMYCGDHEHYDYLTEAFGLFAHVNALQRDMCPSVTKFEAEIISMTLDLFHAEAVDRIRAGRPRDDRRNRQHRPLDARLPRARPPGPAGIERPNVDQARDRAPGVRQGVSSLRDRAQTGACGSR